jgi:mono/diheme cytochrome c family protein
MKKMRSVSLAAILAAIILGPAPAIAAGLDYHASVAPQTLPDLGPAGNGRRRFVEFGCYLCHGNNGAGQIGPNIQHAEAGDISEAVKLGVPEWGMPAYGKYATNADIKNLTAYLNSVGTANEPKWWNWWEPNPTQ